MTDTIADASPPLSVRITGGGTLGHEVRAAVVVMQRELIRMWIDRTRSIAMLVQPVLFLFVLGTGLGTLTAGAIGGVDFRLFMFPGVLATSTLFTAMFSAVSIVWDREFGFLREMMVAPVSRASIMIGKALGGAVVATLQGCVVILLGFTVGMPASLPLVLELIGEIFVISLAITSFGLVIAARIKQMQAVMGIMQMILLPMTMLSGALYPLADLPRWLEALVAINPLTYGVAAVRASVLGHLDESTRAALVPLSPGVNLFGISIGPTTGLLVVAVLAIGLLAVAVAEFARSE